MTLQEIKKTHVLITQLLSKKELKTALDKLGDLAKKTFDSSLIDSHYNIMTTYKSLLHYTVQGIKDPERYNIYQQIIVDLYSLSDKVFLNLYTKHSQSEYYEIKREYDKKKISISEVASNLLKELDIIELQNDEFYEYNEETKIYFEHIFNTLLTQTDIYVDIKTLHDIFRENDLLWRQQCTFVSAIIINLLHNFNQNTALFLYDLTNHPIDHIRNRALVGIFLILYKYDSRVMHYKKIRNIIISLKSTENVKIYEGIIIQLIRSMETEDLERKFKDEILPEMARIHPNLRDRLDLDNIISDSLQEGKNPDWEDIFSDSPELLGKLEEYSKLQMEGSDLFISTFRMLKDFPFFNKISNWFLPFSYPNPEVSEILKNETKLMERPNLLEQISDTDIMCNSDKYSLILSIPMMPEVQKDMLNQMFAEELETIQEVRSNDLALNFINSNLSMTNSFIQDLYRFFKIYPQKTNMEDPFSWKFDFHNKEFIKLMFENDDILTPVGDYLFKRNRFDEALEVLIKSCETDKSNVQLLQKIAFCYQQQNNYQEALQYYLKADLIESDKVWNIKKIALCYLHLNDSENALKHYQRAEEIAPENIHTQVSIAHCLFEMKQYEEASKYYFKVEYLDPKNVKVWRPIVWCTFTLGKFEQAKRYCQKLIEINPTQNDYLNMGHIVWCEGNRVDALGWYQKSVKHPDSSLKNFLESFNNDKATLVNHNVDPDDIPIMLDQLRYYLEN